MQVKIFKNVILNGIYMTHGQLYEVTEKEKAILQKGGFLFDVEIEAEDGTAAKTVSKASGSKLDKASKDTEDGIGGVNLSDLT